jgi:redox-sensitive bicupin YhaK (pirin superfamily)
MTGLRDIELRVKGQRHGPIVRLVSPADMGERLKPFVFLDFLNANIPSGFGFDIHPHSGIATLTYQLNIDVAYLDTEGKEGVLKAKGLEWMRAGGGAWHKGTMIAGGQISGFQLWVALPPGIEDGPSFSQYIEPDAVPTIGGLRILLGEYQGKKSSISTPTSINYFDLSLKTGEDFIYQIPTSHTVAWAFVYSGKGTLNKVETFQEMVIFGSSGDGIEFRALTDCRVIVGTSEPHPYPLLTGYSSVHTNEKSLAAGENRIAEIGKSLKKR